MPVARVYVVSYGDRPDFAMRFRCPITKKQYQRTTGTSDRKLADQTAKEWEDELNEGGYIPPVAVSWRSFRVDFAANRLSEIADTTASKYTDALDKFQDLVELDNLTDVTSHHIDYFRRRLRASGEPLASIDPTVEYVLKAFQWAERERLLKRAPTPNAELV